MLIDWFTVCAQALNFLVLVWLMKRFLYKPILDAIDVREKRIAAQLADASTKKKEAQKQNDEFSHKNDEFDLKRATLLSAAKKDAKAEHQRLLEEARMAADSLSAARHNSLINDAHNLNEAVARRTQQEVFAITRRVLADLASTSLEECMADVFNCRLREMESKGKEELGNALQKATDPALVRSTFELPADQREAIQTAINETFSADIHIKFETAPDLISGIELIANGQKVAWNIADYLGSFEKEVGELLDHETPPK